MAQTSISAKSLREIVFNLQMQMKLKGINCVKALLRNFVPSDRDDSGFLDREEFEELLSRSGIFLSRMDANYLLRHFDKNRDGRLSFDEFYQALVPPLSENRHCLVVRAFAKLDPENSGATTIDTILQHFDVANHPEVATGQRSEHEVAGKFLDLFDASTRAQGAIVTRDEFVECFQQVSASYPHDDEAFAKMMVGVWGLPAGTQRVADVDKLEVMLKDKLQLRMHGTETEEQALLKVFKFIDTDENGCLTPQEFCSALARIGLQFGETETAAFFRRYDADGSGTLDYFEFSRAMMNRRDHLFKQSLAHSFYS